MALPPRSLNRSLPAPRWLGGAVQFRVGISLGNVDSPITPALWDVAEWDVGQWSGGGIGEAYWYDVSPYVLDVKTSRGKDRFEEGFRTGSFSLLLDNQTGIWNPVAGQTSSYALTLRPGRWFRLQAYTDLLGWVPVFAGYVDAINDQFSSGGYGVNTLVSGYGMAGAFQMDRLPALEAPILPGALSSERVEWLLARADWDADFRDIQTGVATMQETTFPHSTLAELLKCAEAEGGAYFHGKDAVPTFKRNGWLKTDPRSVAVQYRIGGPASDIDPLEFVTDWSAQRIYNDIQLTAEGGVPQRQTDTTSWARYFRRSFVKTKLENDDDTQVLALAQEYLAAFAYDRIRIEQVELFPRDPSSASIALETEIGDLVEATVSTGAGWGYTAEAHVMGIDHHITASDWRFSIRLDDSSTTPPIDAGAFDGGFDSGFNIGG